MPIKTKLTVRLLRENIEFLKSYAAEHGLTATEVLDRYLTRLRQSRAPGPIDPQVERISGLAPAEVDAEALYQEHLIKKHR